jgi:hypothetical protein
MAGREQATGPRSESSTDGVLVEPLRIRSKARDMGPPTTELRLTTLAVVLPRRRPTAAQCSFADRRRAALVVSIAAQKRGGG